MSVTDVLKHYFEFMKKFAPYIFMVLGPILLGVAATSAVETNSFIKSAEVISGKVTNFTEYVDSEGSKSYAPNVEYVYDKETLSFISNSASNPPRYSVGQEIEVLINSVDREDVRINGFWELWGSVFIFGFIGFVSLVAGLIAYLIKKKKRGKK